MSHPSLLPAGGELAQTIYRNYFQNLDRRSRQLATEAAPRPIVEA